MDQVKIIGAPRQSAIGAWLSSVSHKALGFVTRVLSLTSREGWPTEDSHAGESVTGDTLLGLSTAWSCINLIAGLTGTLGAHVWKRDPRTGQAVRAADHWLESLLDAPNLDQTDVDFWEFVAASLEMRGNAYCEKRRLTPGSEQIIALEPLRPDTVAVSRNRETGRLQYRFPGADGRDRTLDQDDVWHIRGFGGSPLGGLSTIAFGRHAFGLALAVDKAAATTFRNGARPSGVLKFKEWLKADKRQAAQDKLISDHTSATNAGKPLVLEGGVEWQQISFSPEDAQMLQSRGFSVEDICRWFGVPPILVGHSEKTSSWGTGVSEITQGFVKFAFRRRIKRLEKSARQQLLSARERGEGYFIRFDLEALLRGDPAARSKFYEVMTRTGIMTINECRALENLPPVPGGDVPRLQAQNVPLSLSNGQVVIGPPGSGDE